MEYVFDAAKNQVLSVVAEAVRVAGYGLDFGQARRLEVPKTLEYDAASPVAFGLAKKAKKSPPEVAAALFQSVKTILEERKPEYIESAQAVNGYLNFNFSQKFFADAAMQAVKAAGSYGDFDDNAGKTAIVEYSSPNVGKPMHIGHIRSTILGDAIANLEAASGYKTVRMNYLCEAGAQVAGILLALEQFGMEKISNERDLLGYYVEITKKISADPALKQKEQETIVLMEGGDRSITEKLQKVRELTIGPFEANYERLGIRFDEPVFDSDYVQPGKELVAEAVEKGLAFKDEKGETVAKLEDKPGKLSNLIILRSNGTTLYSTRDLGFAQWRWDKYRFDRSVIVTASEQNTHFRQVFKLLELMGRQYAPMLFHVGFGLIFLEGGVKLSSRKGNVLFLEDVLDEAVEHAKGQIKRTGEYSEADIAQISETVGIGAVKFAILRVSAEKNIAFSIEKSVSFEGDTGAYLQYTVVRAKNILKKAERKQGSAAISDESEFSGPERELARMIALYPDTVRSAEGAMQPHQVCDYSLKLASAFSTFYAACPVLEAESEEKKELRLALVEAAANTLQNALGILGIKEPDKM